MTESYDIQKIRALFTEGFTDAELRRFSYDNPNFRPVYDDLAQETGKAKIIDVLIEYSDRRELFDILLEWAEKENPKKYEKYQPYTPSITPKPDLQTPEVKAIRTWLEIEINTNLSRLRKFWEQANKPQENEVSLDLNTLRLLRATRLSDSPSPNWSYPTLENQFSRLLLALSGEEIKQVYDLQGELNSISDIYSAITGTKPPKITHVSGGIVQTPGLTYFAKKMSERWQELETIINRILERGNPLAEPSENELKILEAFKKVDGYRIRTAEGIAGDLGLSEQVVEAILWELEAKGLVIPPKPNSKRWDLTSEGKRRLGL